jgi:threonine/homoserine/homoserine lactone efflux protein
MWPEQWPTFVGVLVIILCVPGPDFIVIVRHSLVDVRAGLRAAAGNVTGLLVHTTLAAVGVSALLAATPALLDVVRLAGAGYLAWLGIVASRAFLSQRVSEPLPRRARLGRTLDRHSVDAETGRDDLDDGLEARRLIDGLEGRDAQAWPATHNGEQDQPAHPGRGCPALRPYRDGLATNLLNPKAVLFFVGVIPQFVSPDGSVPGQTLVFAATTLTFVVMWWTAVVTVVGRGVQPLIGSGWQRTMDGVSAVAFIALAISFLVALS